MTGYILKLFNRKQICFSARGIGDPPEVFITYVEQDTLSLMLGMEVTDRGLVRLLKHRKIPESRAQIHSFPSKVGLSANSTMAIIEVSRGRSTQLGIKEEFSKIFVQPNFCDNSSVISWPV